MQKFFLQETVTTTVQRLENVMRVWDRSSSGLYKAMKKGVKSFEFNSFSSRQTLRESGKE